MFHFQMALISEDDKFYNLSIKSLRCDHSYEKIPVTKNIDSRNICAVNSIFLAVSTHTGNEGSFIVMPLRKVSCLLICYQSILKRV